MNTQTKEKVGNVLVLLLIVTCAVTIAVSMSKTNMQMTDGKGLGQSFICDGTSRTLTFPNFLTTHSWLEQIRWSDAGSTYNINTRFTIGEPLSLTYTCK